MHDKPEYSTEIATASIAATDDLGGLIRELKQSDPAAAPDIADEIAATLESRLADASGDAASGRLADGPDSR